MMHGMNSLLDQKIWLIAGHQHGIVTRRQALAAGMTDRMIHRRVASGLWKRIEPGTFRLIGQHDSLLSRLAAATTALPAVVSHESAAELHGLAHVPRGRAVVTVPLRTGRRFPDVYVHQSTDLTSDFVVMVADLPATSLPRTIVDLAAVLRPARLERVVDDCLVTKRLPLEDLQGTLSSLARRGKPGVQRLRKTLEGRSPGLEMSESVLERKLVRLLLEAGLPEPLQQFPLPWRAQQSGRVDLAYPAACLLIEADSRRWHSLSEAFETDRRRDNLAMLAGWRVLRFTWQDITDRSAQVVAMIREALAANPPALAG